MRDSLRALAAIRALRLLVKRWWPTQTRCVGGRCRCWWAPFLFPPSCRRSPWLGALVPALYAAATLVAAASTACRRGWYFPLLPLVFATLHLSWGTGFLAGLCRWGVPRVTPRTLRGAIQPLDEG